MACESPVASLADGEDTVDVSADALDTFVDTSPVVYETEFQALAHEVFRPRCADGACHVGPTSMGNGGLNLEPEQAHSALVNRIASNLNAEAEGLALVLPGEPEESFLWLKMGLTEFDPLYANPMPPLNHPPLSPEERERIRAWIVDGALP